MVAVNIADSEFAPEPSFFGCESYKSVTDWAEVILIPWWAYEFTSCAVFFPFTVLWVLTESEALF